MPDDSDLITVLRQEAAEQGMSFAAPAEDGEVDIDVRVVGFSWTERVVVPGRFKFSITLKSVEGWYGWVWVSTFFGQTGYFASTDLAVLASDPRFPRMTAPRVTLPPDTPMTRDFDFATAGLNVPPSTYFGNYVVWDMAWPTTDRASTEIAHGCWNVTIANA